MTKLLKLITLISVLWTVNIYADTKLKNVDSSKKPSQLQQTIKSLKPQVIKSKIAGKGQMSGSYFGGSISQRGKAPQRLNPSRTPDDTRFPPFTGALSPMRGKKIGEKYINVNLEETDDTENFRNSTSNEPGFFFLISLILILFFLTSKLVRSHDYNKKN